VAYQQRLSGPILDRIDLHINVPEHRAESAAVFVDLDQGQASKQTQRLQQIVQQARDVALQRNSQFGVEFNRDLPPQTLIAASGLPHGDFAALVNSMIPRTASNRAVVRCLRVARTLADLRSQVVVERVDIEQAWGWLAEPAARDRGEMVHGLAWRSVLISLVLRRVVDGY
jgi:magnesium chelatase family protein